MDRVSRALLSCLVWVGITAPFAGCSRESFETAAETDSVLTVRRPEFDFSGKQTFAVDPEVRDLSDLVDEPIELTGAFDERVLAGVTQNLVERGWSEVDFPGDGSLPDADVVVTTGKVVSNNWSYFGACFPWFGGGFWWCHPALWAVSYQRGTIVITMVDPEDVETEGDIDFVTAVWAAGLAGLAESNEASAGARIDRAIDQAFLQSPYLDLREPE